MDLTPKDRAEEVALFRAEIIGALARRDLARGELAEELRALAKRHYRPPGATTTRRFSTVTLERWYYAYRAGGLAALRPEPRSDRGRGRKLTPELRELVLDIRREHPSASAPLILRTLVADGRLAPDAVSAPTLRRLFVEQGLDRTPLRDGMGRRTRLRWQAERPGALWQGDVCHGPNLATGPLRIHALLDDASRFVVALEARHTETEADMIAILVAAIRRHGLPDALYLDNGSTYRGEILRVACERLGVTLIHPRPGDAPARGKIERFWRSLREGCLDYVGAGATLHDVDVRLGAFLDQHYHRAPHASLLGRSPGDVWIEGLPDKHASEDALREALTVRERRRVGRDTTVAVGGVDWQLDQGFLAGRVVTICRSLVDEHELPWIEHEGKRLELHRVDPVVNARKKRPPRRETAEAEPPRSVAFDPARALLDRAAGRTRRKDRP